MKMIRKSSRSTLVFLTLSFLILYFTMTLMGCGIGGGRTVYYGGGGTSAPNPTSTTPPENVATFIPGTNATSTSQNIGPSGGTLNASADSPISGVIIEFPPGALSSNININLGYNNGTLTTISGESSGKFITLSVATKGTDETFDFQQPVSITFPITSTDSVPVPYYIDSNGKLHLMQLINIDRENNTAMFQTFHASTFTWIYEPLQNKTESYRTNYRPESDGFQVVNYGSDYNEGECLGMSSFSQWYFINHKSEGDFYPKFMNVVGSDSDGKSILGQNVIATRAHNSVDQDSYYFKQNFNNEMNLSPEENYKNIINALKNTGNPVNMGLCYKDTSIKKGHAVLVYAYDVYPGAAYLSLYDSNHPGETIFLNYSTANGNFETYTDYNFDKYFYIGIDTLDLRESYQNILDDAKNNFNSSTNAKVTVTSHASGSSVSDQNIVMKGSIESSQVLVTQLDVVVGSNSFNTYVSADGTFIIPLTLEIGVNHFKFFTKGNNAHGNLITVGNNMLLQDFTLKWSLTPTPTPTPIPTNSGGGSGGGGGGPTTGTITGKVTDASSSNAINGATVSAGGKNTTTNENGEYTLNSVSAGSQTVTATAKDYRSNSVSAVVIAGGSISSNIQLTHMAWQIDTVDDYQVINYDVSMALDENQNPHIGYFKSTYNPRITHAYYDGTTWQIQTVDNISDGAWDESISIDRNEKPHLSYCSYSGGFIYDLNYAFWDGSSWITEKLDSSLPTSCLYTSMKLDSQDNPHISYFHGGDKLLKYTYWDGSSWQTQTVDVNVHFDHSLALDTNDTPHIAYSSILTSTFANLKYATWDGSSWQTQTLDVLNSSNPSIAIDSSNHPHISYFRSTGDFSSQLNYVFWNGSSWQTQVVDDSGQVGDCSSIALDSSGNSHISYRDSKNGNIKYAYWDNSSWQIQVIDHIGSGGICNTSIVLDSNGYPQICYYDYLTTSLKYAVYK